MGAQETIGQGFIFAQESEKQVLSLDIGRPELAGFIACEKDHPPGLLRIAFKHNAFPLTFLARRTFAGPTCRTTSQLTLIPYIMQSKGLNSQVLKRFYKPLITLPKERLPTVHCYVLHQVLADSLTNLALFNFSLIFTHRSCLQRPRCSPFTLATTLAESPPCGLAATSIRDGNVARKTSYG